MTRIIILGGPRTGKTTLAADLGRRDYETPVGRIAPEVRHTDDLIVDHDWSEVSLIVAREWLDASGPWIIEGVACARALRKWREAHPDEPPPVDRVIRLTTPHVALSKGQAAMAKGEETVWQEIAGWLLSEGVSMDDNTLDSIDV